MAKINIQKEIAKGRFAKVKDAEHSKAKPDGFVYLPEFARLLGKKPAQTKATILKAIEYQVIPDTAIHVDEFTEKGIRCYSYNKSAAALIQKDWDADKGRLPKPRVAKGTAKALRSAPRTSSRAQGNERNVNITIPSKEAFDALTKRFKDISGIVRFLDSKLKEVYEPTLSKRNEIIEATRAKIKELELIEQAALDTLDGGGAVSKDLIEKLGVRTGMTELRGDLMRGLEAEHAEESKQSKSMENPEKTKQ